MFDTVSNLAIKNFLDRWLIILLTISIWTFQDLFLFTNDNHIKVKLILSHMTLTPRVSVKFCRNKITVSFFHTLLWSLKKVLWRPLRCCNKEGLKQNLLLVSTPRPGLRHQRLKLKISTISTILKFRVKTWNNLKQICISLEIWYKYVTFAL